MIRKAVCLIVCFTVILSFSKLNSTYAYSASSYCLYDPVLKKVLASSNMHSRKAMASTTKIMTALIACELCDLTQTVTVSDKMIACEGSSIGLQVGDEISYKDLLYGLMLESGNDAALCLAISISGSEKAFSMLMNEKAKSLGKMIVAHCEINSLLNGGYIHDGEYAKLNGHRGICSESEYMQIERDINLAKKTGCPYHVCHISTRESVDLIRKAKKDGVNITCETAPHYLILDDMDLKDEGRFKMNPPLRSKTDKEALIEGILDGTIDMIATDHAPHSAEEKAKGLEKSAFGIVGIETAFPLMYTNFVKTGIISMEKLIKLMSENPKKRFNIPDEKSFTVWELDKKYKINPDKFISKGRATPFENIEVFGRCVLTVIDGKVVYKI